jgi:hypothetical protein
MLDDNLHHVRLHEIEAGLAIHCFRRSGEVEQLSNSAFLKAESACAFAGAFQNPVALSPYGMQHALF